MARLELDLLGGFSASLDSARPCLLPTRKAQALLAYLAVPAGRFHARDKLTALLWGDTPESQARQSFRQALAGLRRALGAEAAGLVATRGDLVGLDGAAVGVDVAVLEAGAASSDPAVLERAAAVCKGEFLAGLRIDEPAFEEWRAVERERVHSLSIDVLGRLLERQTAADQPDAAIQTAFRLLALDPLQEAVHRSLMRLLLRRGRRAAALRQYQVCVGYLERELGVEPEEATRQLYREILRSAANAPDRARGTAPTVLSAAGEEPPLVGRRREIEMLRDALSRMLDDGGGVVELRGEAGIGKSRLLHELAAEAAQRGLRLALGRCHETEQILPLHPWVDALRGGAGALDLGLRDRLGPAAAAQLARVFPELLADARPAGPGEQFAQLFDALLKLIEAMAQERPLIVILEDVHWADSLSARFLAFVGRRLAGLPVLVIASLRPEDLVEAPTLAQALAELRAGKHAETVTLQALTQDETRELTRALRPALRRGLAAERVEEAVWAASEGNPFVIVESVRVLAEDSVASPDNPLLSRSVRDFVATRLDRLGELPRTVVATAAAIGRSFPFLLLTRAAGLPEPEAAGAVEELVRRGILAADGDRLAFCHDWIRQVAYERLLPQRRRLLHAAIGGALEALYADRLDSVADQLGHHYSRGGDPAKALAHLVRFAELAAGSYALDDALRTLQQAMAAVDQLPAGERDRAALDLALRQAFVLSSLARPREVRELLRRHADRVGRVGDPSLASEYHFRLGLTAIYLGERAASRRAATEALTEGEASGDPERIGKALYVLSLSDYEAGRPSDGIRHATRAIALLERLPGARIWLGLVYYDLALNCLVSGALDAALDAAAQADAVGNAAGWPRVRALAGYVAAWGLALRGDCDTAIETARCSLELSRDPTAASLVAGSLALAHLERGEGTNAVEILSEVVAQLRKSPVRSGEVRHMALLAEAHLVAGQFGPARETAAAALDMAHGDDMAFNTGLALRAIGRIALAEGDLRRGEAALGEALAGFVACEAAFEAARTRLDLAKALARRGASDAAGVQLAAALPAFEMARAPKRAAELRAIAASLGLASAIV